jgi:hypothetical protein
MRINASAKPWEQKRMRLFTNLVFGEVISIKYYWASGNPTRTDYE